MEKKYALALSGGGFKGAYQIGALRYLREHWKEITGKQHFHFDLICGVSAGALNGSLIASQQFDSLKNLWEQIQKNGGKEVYHSSYITNRGKVELNFKQLRKDLLPDFKVNLEMILKGSWNELRRVFDKKKPDMMTTILNYAEKDFNKNFSSFRALADNDPLKDKLTQYVKLQKIPDNTLYRCGLVSLDDGLYYSFSNKDFVDDKDFVWAVLASSSMPIIWPPVDKIRLPVLNKIIKNSVDGGIRNNSPLEDVVHGINSDPEDIPYEVIIINCNSGYLLPEKGPRNIGDIALRSLTEITLAEIFNDDIREFLKMNSFVKQAAAGNITLTWKGKPRRHFDYKIIEPRGDELGETLDSRSEMIEKRFQLGYQHAKKAFEEVDYEHK